MIVYNNGMYISVIKGLLLLLLPGALYEGDRAFVAHSSSLDPDEVSQLLS